MTANVTHYEFFLPSDEDSNSSEPNHRAEINLTNQKADKTVEKVTPVQDTEDTSKRQIYIEKGSIVPEIPEEAAMKAHSKVPESDKSKQLDVAKLKFISPIKSDLIGDVCDPKTKALQPERSIVHQTDDAQTPGVVDGKELLSHESQDHEEKVLGDDNAGSTKSFNKSADATMSELPSSCAKIEETARKERKRNFCIEKPANIPGKNEQLEKELQQNGSSDKQTDFLIKTLERANSEESMEIEFKEEPSMDVSMAENNSHSNLLAQSAKNCAEAMQEFIRQKLSEDQDSSSENSECYEFIETEAQEGEEDTPSEDSNAIPDHGESIGFSDSEQNDSPDEYGSSDSFICDDEIDDLLSGHEYDLEYEEKKPKRSRIIDAELLGDEPIIKIPKKGSGKEKVQEVPKKRKRIVEMHDSSSDEETIAYKETSKVTISESPLVVAEASHCKETRKSGNFAEVLIGDISIMSTNSSVQNACKNSFISIHKNVGEEKQSAEEHINTLVQTFCAAVKNGQISLNICHDSDDLANFVLSNSLIKDQIRRGIESEASKSDLPNGAKSINGDDPGAKNSANSKKDVTEIENKKKRNQKAKIVASELSENQPTPEKLERRLLKKINSRDAEFTTSSEENQITKHRKKHKKLKKTSITALCEEIVKKHVSDLRNEITLFDQLITDVKNRPRRVIRPSRSAASEIWIETEAPTLTPSASLISKKRVSKKCIRRILKTA